MMIKKWKWAYGKMLNPEVLYVSANFEEYFTTRLCSQSVYTRISSFLLSFNILKFSGFGPLDYSQILLKCCRLNFAGKSKEYVQMSLMSYFIVNQTKV